MKNQKWRKLPALICAAALAFAAAGAEEPPAPLRAETEKEYELVLEVAGPLKVSISHAAENPDADPVKDADRAPAGTFVLREGPDYDVRLDGTGEGTLDYTVTLRDPAGKEEDRVLHRFEDVPVNGETVLKAVTGAKDRMTLLAFAREGDGEDEKLTVNAAYGSGKNSPVLTVNTQTILLAGALLLVLAALLLFRRKKKIIRLQKPILLRVD